jgi:hypothetical protein
MFDASLTDGRGGNCYKTYCTVWNAGCLVDAGTDLDRRQSQLCGCRLGFRLTRLNQRLSWGFRCPSKSVQINYCKVTPAGYGCFLVQPFQFTFHESLHKLPPEDPKQKNSACKYCSSEIRTTVFSYTLSCDNYIETFFFLWKVCTYLPHYTASLVLVILSSVRFPSQPAALSHSILLCRPSTWLSSPSVLWLIALYRVLDIWTYGNWTTDWTTENSCFDFWRRKIFLSFPEYLNWP